MKCSIIAALLFGALLAGVSGQPSGMVLGYQDALGQYSFGYTAPQQSRSEVRSVDGVTRGAYSYVDGAGSIQSAEYTADGKNGFRVAATSLPQAPEPVQDTPEVAAARAAHLLAVEEATRAVENPQKETDEPQIISKSAEPGEPGQEADEKEPVKSEETIVEKAASEIEPQSNAEVKSVEEASEVPAAPALGKEEQSENQQQQQQQEKGKAIENLVVPLWYNSVGGSLPVPLIPVNFDIPSISAYSQRPGGPAIAKVDQPGFPQAAPTQGLLTPAGTTLKTLPEGASAEARQPPQPSASGFSQYEKSRASAVFAPVGSLVRFDYHQPTVTTFLRYAPFPYVHTYNFV